MTNLLPQEQQRVIRREYAYRRTIVALGVLACAVLVSAGFLVPSYILSGVRLQEAERASLTMRAQETPRGQEALAVLADTRAKIALLAGDEGATATDVVDRITRRKTDNIKIGSIVFSHKTTDNPGLIMVTGLAKDRESLTSFLKSIQSDVSFSSASVPVSNFAKDRDIPFSMEITGDF